MLSASNASSGTFNSVYLGSLTPTDSTDFFRFRTPKLSQTVMTVSLWGLDNTSLDPAVTILDGSGNPVASTVIQDMELWMAKGKSTLTLSAITNGAASPTSMQWNLDSEPHSDPMMSSSYAAPGGSTTTDPPTTTA